MGSGLSIDFLGTHLRRSDLSSSTTVASSPSTSNRSDAIFDWFHTAGECVRGPYCLLLVIAILVVVLLVQRCRSAGARRRKISMQLANECGLQAAQKDRELGDLEKQDGVAWRGGPDNCSS